MDSLVVLIVVIVGGGGELMVVTRLSATSSLNPYTRRRALFVCSKISVEHYSTSTKAYHLKIFYGGAMGQMVYKTENPASFRRSGSNRRRLKARDT